MEIKEGTKFCIKFFGSANGVFAADRRNEGLDVFSPLVGTSAQGMVQLVGKGASIKPLVNNIHLVSVKRRKQTMTNPTQPFDRLSCYDFQPIGENGGGWWSVPLIEFRNSELMDSAIETLISETPGSDVKIIKVSELQSLCEELAQGQDREMKQPAQSTLRVLKELAKVRVNNNRCLPSEVNNQPLRFDLANSIIIYTASTNAQDANGYYTNLPRQGSSRNRGRGNQQTQISEVATD